MVLAFIVLFTMLAFASVGCVSAATHYVNHGESIQDAVNAADPSDTIIVRDGTYTEHINVDKCLTIQSENGTDFTIVQAANSDDHVFEVTADYVNISGFTVKEATGHLGDQIYGAGIYLYYAGYCSIYNNNASNDFFGIYLLYSNNNSISNNSCSHNSKGIFLNGHSNNNIILNNNCSYNADGIALWHSNNNIILNNNCSYNTFQGIHLENSNNNSISNNNCSYNYHEDGIFLWRSNNNSISNNNCSYNSENGIALSDSNNNNITNNNCLYNSKNGIYLVDSNNNKIYLNNFINNGDNVRYKISTNIWNSPEEITYSYKGKAYTNYLGNYLDDYTGGDADSDGIGDTSYSINSDKEYYPLMEKFENYIKAEKEEREVIGFEVFFTITGLLAVVYLLRKRG